MRPRDGAGPLTHSGTPAGLPELVASCPAPGLGVSRARLSWAVTALGRSPRGSHLPHSGCAEAHSGVTALSLESQLSLPSPDSRGLLICVYGLRCLEARTDLRSEHTCQPVANHAESIVVQSSELCTAQTLAFPSCDLGELPSLGLPFQSRSAHLTRWQRRQAGTWRELTPLVRQTCRRTWDRTPADHLRDQRL